MIIIVDTFNKVSIFNTGGKNYENLLLLLPQEKTL